MGNPLAGVFAHPTPIEMALLIGFILGIAFAKKFLK